MQEVSISAAHFFAAAAGESLLVLVSLSLSGVSLRLSGLLAILVPRPLYVRGARFLPKRNKGLVSSVLRMR